MVLCRFSSVDLDACVARVDLDACVARCNRQPKSMERYVPGGTGHGQ